jgi:hypothetical protein
VWTNDQWWASQFIRGLNPMMIRRVSPPTNFTPLSGGRVSLPSALVPMDDAMASNILSILSRGGDRASTLDELISEGRLFFVDYVDLDDVLTWGDRVLMSPIALFYINSRDRLLWPLLIQLERASNLRSGERPRLSFPAAPMMDGTEDATNEQLVWLFAKMHVSSSDASVHQTIFHLCETHLAMEPTIIATHRAFSEKHPVRKLLTQHFTGQFQQRNERRSTGKSLSLAYLVCCSLCCRLLSSQALLR